MDLNQPHRPGTAGDPASHLQFQISLLRLMDQKAGLNAAPSVQVAELERLQRPRQAKVQLQIPH